MSNSIGQRSNGAKKLLLATAGVVALAGLLVIGLGDAPAIGAQSTVPAQVQGAPIRTPAPRQESGAGSKESPPVFDAASIKPNTFSGGGRDGRDGVLTPRAGAGGGLHFTPGRVATGPSGVTVWKIILEAFDLTQYQVSGGPGWLDSARFDLEAKAEGANENQLRRMLQTLLADRFKLVVHRETKEMPVYALVVAKNGPKFHEWKEGDTMPRFDSDDRLKYIDRGTMQHLADVLTSGPDAAGRPVLDKTGLKGVYVFYVVWDQGGDFLPALQQQLGLKLEPQRSPGDNLVIDHIEKPEAN